MVTLPPLYHRPTATPIFSPKSQKITFQYIKILSPKDFVPFPRTVSIPPPAITSQTIRVNIYSNGSYAKQLSYIYDTPDGPRTVSLPWSFNRFYPQSNDVELEILVRITKKCKQLEKKGFNRV